MFLDGLEDAYDRGRLMGTFAEDCAAHYQFTREAQDRYAITSLTRAQDAIKNGGFAREVVPVTIAGGKAETVVRIDEQPLKANLDKIPQLKPAFRKDGTVTRRQFELDLGWRGGHGAHEALGGGAARHRAARAHRRLRHAFAGAAVVHHGAGRRDPQAVRENRLERARAPISSRSTKRSRWSPWRRCTTSTCRTTR